MKGGAVHEVENNRDSNTANFATQTKGEKHMARYMVTAFPYATQQGPIYVPDEVVKTGEEKVREYISNNWNNIEFGEPDLDYAGTDFDIDEGDY